MSDASPSVSTLDVAIASGAEVVLVLRSGSVVYARPVTLDHEHVTVAFRGARSARVPLAEVARVAPIASWSASA